MVLTKRQLQGHADLYPFRLAVGELHVHPAAAIEVDHHMGRRRVWSLSQVIMGEGKDFARAQQLHFLKTVAVSTFNTNPMKRELDRAALGALPAVQRQDLLLVTEQHDRGGDVGGRIILAHQLAKAGVLPVGRQGPLDLDLRVNTPHRAKTGNRFGHLEYGGVSTVSIANRKNQISGLGSFEHRGKKNERLGRAGITDGIPERVLHLRFGVSNPPGKDRI